MNLKTSKKSGFTLIELLVVVAIIALLMAILLPSLSKARDRAKNVQCASNIRQIALAVTMYTNENGNVFPLREGAAPWNASVSLPWCYFMKDYLPDGVNHGIPPVVNTYNKVYMCPSEDYHHTSIVDYAPNTPRVFDTRGNQNRRVTSIVNPGSTVMMLDAREHSIISGVETPTGYQGSWQIHTNYVCGNIAYIGNPWVSSPYPPRHGEYMNFAFVDSHVEPFRMPTPMTSSVYNAMCRLFLENE
jgi:prepilin-type N-terminal cleavage/methylation domain-containing protein/prepilin-type processing-associated H-X9-DG protein